jgi:hypothetical protein
MEYFSKQIDTLKKATLKGAIDTLKGDVCCMCPQKPIDSYYALAGERTKAGMAAVGLADSLTSCTICAKLFCPKHTKSGIWRRDTDKYKIPESLYARPISKGILGSLSSSASKAASVAKTAVVGATKRFACDEPNLSSASGCSCRSHLINLWMEAYRGEMRELLRVDAPSALALMHMALAYDRPTEMTDDKTTRSLVTALYAVEVCIPPSLYPIYAY